LANKIKSRTTKYLCSAVVLCGSPVSSQELPHLNPSGLPKTCISPSSCCQTKTTAWLFAGPQRDYQPVNNFRKATQVFRSVFHFRRSDNKVQQGKRRIKRNRRGFCLKGLRIWQLSVTQSSKFSNSKWEGKCLSRIRWWIELSWTAFDLGNQCALFSAGCGSI
jgi:hypothetical protein